jgi:3-hydroxyisobutyrate dehydrogenase/glyoxylate/succinic semialdehyde reductase
MKTVVNLLLGNAMAAFAEGMALGEGLGISRKVLFDSLLGTPAVAPFIALKREKIESGNYEAEFPLRWMQKDLHLASVSAYESGVAMPLTNAAKELYRLAMMEGHSIQDFSAIYAYLASNSDSASASARNEDHNQRTQFYKKIVKRFSDGESGMSLLSRYG